MSKEKAGQSKKIHDDDCYVVIYSDSDDEYFPEKDGNEILEVLSDIDDIMIHEFPIIISDDDDSNVEGPVTTEEDAADEMASIEKKMDQCALSPCNSSHENLCQLPNAAKVEVDISDINMLTDGELVPVPRKRKCKTKNICVTPGKPVKPSTPYSPKWLFKNTDCNIAGCFLGDTEKLKQYSGRKFKRNKDELVQKLYALMNNTVFENKLPERLDIHWNNKMLRTAGLCSSGLFHYRKEHYTKIEISLKVCDSAD
uniref:Uncharacterized protein n=1 Tax=Pipistrellus kuhlii TaxID=59472 RepID=A0A7J7SFX9_PIPKU|nr:hypothetical protein mPipKuh1_009956 [Pipistrellus kuhlii]